VGHWVSATTKEWRGCVKRACRRRGRWQDRVQRGSRPGEPRHDTARAREEGKGLKSGVLGVGGSDGVRNIGCGFALVRRLRGRVVSPTLRNAASMLFATARASRVFPVPGGPYRRQPLGALMPTRAKSSGLIKGSSITWGKGKGGVVRESGIGEGLWGRLIEGSSIT
jgi:hypothetical protein